GVSGPPVCRCWRGAASPRMIRGPPGGDTTAEATSGEGASSGSPSAGQAPQAEDLAGYACALVADIDGSAQDWASGPDGEGAERTSLAAASDLLGATSGSPLKGYDELFQSR